MTVPTTGQTKSAVGNSLQHGLFRSGLRTALIRAVGLALTLGVSVFLARVMGAEGLGQYTLAFAVISLLGLPVHMGLPSLVLRETARAKAARNWQALRGIWYWATRRILLVSALIVLLGGSLTWAVHWLFDPSVRSVFLVGLPLVPLIALSKARAGALRGLGQVAVSQVPEDLLRPMVLILLGAVSYLVLQQDVSPVLMMGLHLVAASFAFIVGTVLLLRARPREMVATLERVIESREWAKAIWPLALIASVQSVMANADFLMLGLWRDAADVGQYKVATSGAALCAVGLGVVAMVINPRFAALHQVRDMAGLSRIAAIGAGMGFVAAAPLALVLAIWAAPILSFVFGEEYAGGASALTILALAQTLNAFFGSCIGLLNMTGHEKKAMRGFLISTVLNVGLNAMLIPIWGMEGAATSTLVSTAVWNLLLWRSARMTLAIDSSVMGLFGRKGKA